MIITYDIETFSTMAIGEPEAGGASPEMTPVAAPRLQTVTESAFAETSAERDFSSVIAGQLLAKLSA